jgi:hypothetical protein
MVLRCVFCGGPLGPGSCVWVQLPDGGDFVCCPGVCAPMRDAIETRRREVAADRRRLAIPPEPRSVGAGAPRPGTGAASWPADDPPRRRL